MEGDEGLRKHADADGHGPSLRVNDGPTCHVDAIMEVFNKEILGVGTKEESTKFETGAVRSADANHLDFTSLPLVGLIAVARTAGEGGTKYGRWNYLQGMPVHDLLNHSFRHLVMYTLGDRSEPHLEHAAWGVMAAIQQETLDPSLSKPHMLGPGAMITQEVKKYLDDNKDRLAELRKSGEFDGIGNWKLTDLPEIQRLLEQRNTNNIATGGK